eukprot:CAMPEP_0117445660 /NCGR_PEP_ID=MMETSP0759-20121206/5917_1 /TAXON_ID=63605 /ORGANISM="Percolomonas cosmopolitus, Strain WS" /LENGTH=42 /DNA_ID= /DNA_START= /DNA_END= /DNA_ORIENTATION=
MASFHADKFQIHCYMDYKQHHCVDEVYQFDSIEKFDFMDYNT